MGEALRKTAWFIGLWLAGVGTVAAVGLVVRAFLA
ncbi:hypothetical protein EDE05_14318 [Neorhizobium sp. R1-B]|jgi:hypothetical protein|nr:hypothetical protein EDE09_1405 [Neorhizobium sp. S3-V5DH]TDX68770.1 hypothetical protein EDE05_14318 [Neorhizobium sp. R1-B]